MLFLFLYFSLSSRSILFLDFFFITQRTRFSITTMIKLIVVIILINKKNPSKPIYDNKVFIISSLKDQRYKIHVRERETNNIIDFNLSISSNFLCRVKYIKKKKKEESSSPSRILKTVFRAGLVHFPDNNFIRFSLLLLPTTNYHGHGSFDIRPILLRDQPRFIRCNNNVYPRYSVPRVFQPDDSFTIAEAQPVCVSTIAFYTLYLHQQSCHRSQIYVYIYICCNTRFNSYFVPWTLFTRVQIQICSR